MHHKLEIVRSVLEMAFAMVINHTSTGTRSKSLLAPMDRGRAKEEEPDHYTQSYNVHCNGNSPQWIHSLSIFRCLYTCSAKWIWIKYRQYTISTLNSVVENHLNVQSGSGRSAVLVVLNSIPECLHRFCDTCIEQDVQQCGAECPTCRARIANRRGLRKDQLLENIGSPK